MKDVTSQEKQKKYCYEVYAGQTSHVIMLINRQIMSYSYKIFKKYKETEKL